MIKHKDHFHGSDLEKIEEVYKIKKEDIISFSANVNPLGISPKLKTTLSSKIDAITTYPDREYTTLRKCIAKYIDSDFNNIIVGNGSTELISLFIQFKAPKKAIIIGPTYSEYEREIAIGGGRSFYYPLLEENDFLLDVDALDNNLTQDIDLLVLCNPNNPTSSSITKNDIEKLLNICKQKDIFVMIDETYVEFTENMQDITSIPFTNIYDNLIILRGISKFFASPGLRLGYAICGNKQLLEEINKKKNPWTINTLASIAGEIMFEDTSYIKETKALISSERTRIYNELCSIPQIKVYKPSANFVLFKLLTEKITAMDIFEACIQECMMVRDCSTFTFLDERYVRFCFMQPEQNTKLLNIIKERVSK